MAGNIFPNRLCPELRRFFVGWNYIPVYSGSYQTSTAALEKNLNINIDFKNIQDIQIVGSSVYLFEPGKTTVLNCSNTVSPQKAADAVRSRNLLLPHLRKNLRTML